MAQLKFPGSWLHAHKAEKLDSLLLVLLLVILQPLLWVVFEHHVVSKGGVCVRFVYTVLHLAKSVHEIPVVKRALAKTREIAAIADSSEVWSLELWLLVGVACTEQASGGDSRCSGLFEQTVACK